MKFVVLKDRSDRLGSNIMNYISTIFFAITNNYLIKFEKHESEYSYSKSIFVVFLFDFIKKHNNKISCDVLFSEEVIFTEEFIEKMCQTLKFTKCDFVTFFKENIFDKNKFNQLAFDKNYILPFDCERTILVHLRLDDVYGNNEYNPVEISNEYKNIIDNDCDTNNLPKTLGQSPIDEDNISKIINTIKQQYNDYEVIIVTSPISKHNLPYKTICTDDESYDLYLLSKCKVLIGSRSTFSFSSLLFGEYTFSIYPLWEHAVFFGLTTKYDKTNNITLFF